MYSLREKEDIFLGRVNLYGESAGKIFFSLKSSQLSKVLLPQEFVISVKNTALLFKESICVGKASLYFLLHSHLTNTEPA